MDIATPPGYADYDVASIVCDETIRSVVAEMSGSGLQPLSDEERHERWLDNQLWLDECRQRDEQWRFEYQQESAKAAAARVEAAIVAEQKRSKTWRERCKSSAKLGSENWVICG